MKTSITIEVRPTEIDAMGHVNNAKYLEYMEWSREHWYNQIQLPFDHLTSMNIGTVTVNINTNYRKEVRLGDQLTIFTKPIRKGRTSFVVKHEIYSADNALVTDALVTCVTIDLQTRKATPLPTELETIFREESSK